MQNNRDAELRWVEAVKQLHADRKWCVRKVWLTAGAGADTGADTGATLLYVYW